MPLQYQWISAEIKPLKERKIQAQEQTKMYYPSMKILAQNLQPTVQDFTSKHIYILIQIKNYCRKRDWHGLKMTIWKLLIISIRSIKQYTWSLLPIPIRHELINRSCRINVPSFEVKKIFAVFIQSVPKLADEKQFNDMPVLLYPW